MEARAEQLIAAVADAAARWCNADFPPRVRTAHALAARTGYSAPVVDYALDRLFGAVTREALRATIAGELGALEALDGFVARQGRPDVWFRPAGKVAIVSSDTTIGVALHPLVFAVCAKAEVLVKDREDRLIAAFAETLAQERPELAERVTSQPWDGAEGAARLAEAGVVVAFGRDATLRAIRAALPPQTRFVPFGHRTSVGYVTRTSLGDEAAARRCARAAALDALLYDGDGCLSLHALFVERGGAIEPERFARLVSEACDEVAVEFPAGPLHDERAALYRKRLLFRAAQGAGAVHSGAHGGHTVAYDPPGDEPPPLFARTLALHAVRGPGEALAYLREHALPLEGFATDVPPGPELLAAAVAGGATRIARLGTLQDPPLGGEHGGAGRILPFVRAIYRS
ncbi:MAG: acyl-CoA reductase [Candidatus Baltobacteraceae bacterium]